MIWLWVLLASLASLVVGFLLGIAFIVMMLEPTGKGNR